jgi:ATP-dependent Clp protease adaptor protein ClpS
MSLANRIHRSGRAIVWSGHLELAELYHDQLASRGLTMAPLEQG